LRHLRSVVALSLASAIAILAQTKMTLENWLKTTRVSEPGLALGGRDRRQKAGTPGVLAERPLDCLQAIIDGLEDEVMIIVVNMSIVEEAANVEINLPRIHNFDPEKHYLLKDLLSSKIYDRTGSKLTVNLKPGKSHIFLVDQSWG